MSSIETGSICSKKRQYAHRRAKVLSDEQREADKNAKIICNNKREKFKSIREMIVGQNKWIQFRKNQILAGSLSIPEKRKTINAIQSMKTRIKNALEQEFQAAKIRHLEERATQLAEQGLLQDSFEKVAELLQLKKRAAKAETKKSINAFLSFKMEDFLKEYSPLLEDYEMVGRSDGSIQINPLWSAKIE
jgi:hypothetical protein